MGPCSAAAESGDGRAVFAMMPSGQLKMPRLGNYCLTVAGEGVADADIAQGADVTATSANAQHVVEHIAGESDGGWLFRASCIFSCLRADGDAQSYWASGPDPASRVDVQLDFGTSRQIKAVEIDWEHPAQVCLFILALVFWFALQFGAWLCARPSSFKLRGGACGRRLLQSQGTICRRPVMWGRLFRARRCGSG